MSIYVRVCVHVFLPHCNFPLNCKNIYIAVLAAVSFLDFLDKILLCMAKKLCYALGFKK